MDKSKYSNKKLKVDDIDVKIEIPKDGYIYLGEEYCCLEDIPVAYSLKQKWLKSGKIQKK